MKEDEKSKDAEFSQQVFCKYDVYQIDGGPLPHPLLLVVGVIVFRNVHFAFKQCDWVQKI